ncbi:MAG: Uma2 family endonuclease [Cyanobacteria bacterium SBLK]|nr:Uma2 family endonuclease [Cyanobacteria bacterium SBLK]
MVSQPLTTLPDHTQLPCEDGIPVKNFQEHPQSILITTSIRPILDRLHPDGQYDIGQDCGIYWRITNPPLKGCISPDWFYIPNIPPLLNGQMRRSYVLWQEQTPPAIALEFVSGNGNEERDLTPETGKFWVYETQIQPEYYGIYEVREARVEVYRLVNGRYQLMSPNARGHFPIEPLGVELGIWQGVYQNHALPWLRWWDSEGNLLLTAEEKLQDLRDRLRAAGIDPDAI